MTTSTTLAPQDKPDELAALPQYFREVGRGTLLTGDEEKALARALRGADPAAGRRARQQLVECNLRLVITVARRYLATALRVGASMDLADLIQEENIGLFKAVAKFDPERGYRFSTYAYWWIRQAITRAIADRGRAVRLPVHVTEQLTALTEATTHVEQRLGRVATHQELADELGVDVPKVASLISLARAPMSLDEPWRSDAGEEDHGSLRDRIPDRAPYQPDDAADEADVLAVVHGALALLTEPERKVLSLRYGIADGQQRSLAQVGREIEVSRERAWQVEIAALAKLRRQQRLKGLVRAA